MQDLYQSINDYRKLDLYLLLVLKTLLTECSVSRTAEKLSVTQPAISKSLAKLREVLDDELFQRGTKQLIPTARALSMTEQLDTIFAQVDRVMKPVPFDPLTYKGRISFAVMEPFIPVLLTPLVEELAKQAPGISLTILTLAEGYQRHGEGRADFMLLMETAESAQLPGYNRQVICKDEGLSGLVSAHHPLAGKSATLDNYMQLTHITPRTSLPDLALAQALTSALESQDLTRTIALDCSQQNILLDVLKRTDYVLGLSTKVCNAISRQEPELAVVDLHQVSQVIAIPQRSYNLLTMERYQNSAVHQWFGQKVVQILHRQLLAGEQ